MCGRAVVANLGSVGEPDAGAIAVGYPLNNRSGWDPADLSHLSDDRSHNCLVPFIEQDEVSGRSRQWAQRIECWCARKANAPAIVRYAQRFDPRISIGGNAAG